MMKLLYTQVSLFAESFKQMLQRDHALTIYKALYRPLPEIVLKDTDDTDDKKEPETDEPDAKKPKVEDKEVRVLFRD